MCSCGSLFCPAQGRGRGKDTGMCYGPQTGKCWDMLSDWFSEEKSVWICRVYPFPRHKYLHSAPSQLLPTWTRRAKETYAISSHGLAQADLTLHGRGSIRSNLTVRKLRLRDERHLLQAQQLVRGGAGPRVWPLCPVCVRNSPTGSGP